ncbi:uncharacterized protein LOC8025523 [Ixodes scapularis]|uniref:uncharacterized protein LOC8025523 n=1 Tax=Ixodes scapularis TaxID=6945 RepID=UPI001A9D79AA|nr:uncharacterized protein LOC8025523 [Ixodes scapularis]
MVTPQKRRKQRRRSMFDVAGSAFGTGGRQGRITRPSLLIVLWLFISAVEAQVSIKRPIHHTAMSSCPEKIQLWHCMRLTWAAPPCHSNFDCAMPFPCCTTWCRNFCANDFRS